MTNEEMDYADHMCHAAIKAIRGGMSKEIAVEAFSEFWDSVARLEDIRHDTELERTFGETP